MTVPKDQSEFLAALTQSLADGSFVKLSLASYKGSETDLKAIHVRKILIKNIEKLSFTARYKTRDIIKNHDVSDGIAKIGDAFKDGFQSASLYTTSFDLTLENNRLKKKPPTQTDATPASHDRDKNRLVGTAEKSYLHALKITDDRGAVLKSAQDKYRQINKFVEIMSGLIANIPLDRLHKIADMGAGKGYLTFALYDYLQTIGSQAQVTGVEIRVDLVGQTNTIARDAGMTGLNFVEGTIDSYDSSGVNVLIALHACDTATDDAIAKGIKSGADLIVVAPCCHKQIRREMKKNNACNDLDFLIRHGIFMERQAEMVTDALRGLILEYCGYKVKIFEFISDAHTPKNVLIVAEKNTKSAPNRTHILEQIQTKKAYFGVGHHHLETLLAL